MYSTYESGPAVGVENGTVLIAWPARLKGSTANFVLVPVAAQWTSNGALRVIIMRPDGSMDNLDVLDLQFDPKWERPK